MKTYEPYSGSDKLTKEFLALQASLGDLSSHYTHVKIDPLEDEKSPNFLYVEPRIKSAPMDISMMIDHIITKIKDLRKEDPQSIEEFYIITAKSAIYGRYLLHYMQDLHQPLHTALFYYMGKWDKGGTATKDVNPKVVPEAKT